MNAVISKQPGKSLKDVDRMLDYIPILSTATNLVFLFQKCVVIPLMTENAILKSRYYSHINQKSFVRCIVLLIPVLGNIVVGIIDVMQHKKSVVKNGPESKIGRADPFIGSQLIIDPFTLIEQPEDVLNRLVKDLDTFDTYFIDNISKDTDCNSRLSLPDVFRYLFDGERKRVIHLHDEMPVYSANEVSEKEKQTLYNLGVMFGRCFFGRCFQKATWFTGRILPDRYFELLLNSSLFDDTLSIRQKIRMCSLLAVTHKDLFALYLRLGPVGSNGRYQDLSNEDRFAVNKALNPKNRKVMSDQDLNELFEGRLGDICHRMILAAREIARGMRDVLKKNPQPAEYLQCSEKIQGPVYSGNEVARRIAYSGCFDVGETKTKWIKEHIVKPTTTKKWVESFLLAVTGHTRVTPRTNITIVDTEKNEIRADPSKMELFVNCKRPITEDRQLMTFMRSHQMNS
ncbi:MAG: Uncharacterized protein HW387_415 [Parachlamydiales bacterium]|nr:Uncharacterized protein [Parachlamydiales bacterium]